MKYDTPPVPDKGDAQKPPQDAKRKSAHRFETLNMFWARGPSEGKLKPSESLVWLCMWAAERNGFVAISYSQIARETHLGLATVSRAIATLIKPRNMVKVVKRGDITGHVNRYVLSPYPSEGTLTDMAGAYAQFERRPMLKSAQTYAQNEPHPEGEEEVSSSLQNGPADARHSAARPVLGEQTNSGRGENSERTNPPGSAAPPSMSTEQQTRAYVRSRIAKLQSTGLRKEAIVGRIIPEFRDDPTAKGWAWDELARSLATATATATPSSRGTSVEESSW